MLNYNGLRYLKETINPVLTLNYPSYEFIIVDNGSSDGSIEYIKSLNRIILIKSPKVREKNFACNYAIKKAKGDYILLLDNDALLTEKDLLIDLVKMYNSKKKVGVIGLSFVDKGEKKTPSYGGYFGYYFIKMQKPIGLSKVKSLNGITIGSPEGKGLFIKKSIWVKVGGYDEHLIFGGDDTDLGIKLWLIGYKNYLFSKSIQVHLGLPERQDNNKYTRKWKENYYAYLYTVFKNYSKQNLAFTFFGLTLFGFIKSIKQALFRLNLGPICSFFQGFYLFLKNLPYVKEKRKEIQSKRVIKKDIFLTIKPRL